MSFAARSPVEKPLVPNQKIKGKILKKKPTKANKVIQKDSSFKLPFWLKLLLAIQKSSGAISFGIITTSFIVYGAIVCTQQLWGKEYRKLKTLQRQERNLTEINETLKNDLANLAEKPETGLVPLDSKKSIFLNPTPVKLNSEIKEKIDNRPLQNKPRGY